MAEWSKAVDLRPTIVKMRGFEPLSVQIKKVQIKKRQIKSYKSSCSSVGQSIGLMSQRSAVQTRIGALIKY